MFQQQRALSGAAAPELDGAGRQRWLASVEVEDGEVKIVARPDSRDEPHRRAVQRERTPSVATEGVRSDV
jgi:hypothetical protein